MYILETSINDSKMATEEWKENNKDKMREYRRSWYYRNREQEIQKAIERNKKAKKRNREFVNRYKSFCSCSRCDEDRSICLEFHHINSSEKDKGISRACNDGWSIKRIKEEIRKCILLCSNCHKIEHQ